MWLNSLIPHHLLLCVMTCGTFWFQLIVDCGVIEMKVRIFQFKQIYCTVVSLNTVKELCVFNSSQEVSVNKFEDVFILN